MSYALERARRAVQFDARQPVVICKRIVINGGETSVSEGAYGVGRLRVFSLQVQIGGVAQTGSGSGSRTLLPVQLQEEFRNDDAAPLRMGPPLQSEHVEQTAFQRCCRAFTCNRHTNWPPD